jgi:Family of unknown function (DUF6502)
MAALRDVLAPWAQLAIARGVRYAELDDMLKDVLIQAARHAHADVPLARSVSRISATTGINRREVTRLTQTNAPQRPPPIYPVTALFARWVSDPMYQTSTGEYLRLPRLGPAPSFESLAESVNRDVRPRALLEELCRLGIARVYANDDTVELIKDSFIPSNDEGEMLRFLGANVGDHLSAAVDNISGEGVRHLEQALFTDELSARSIEEVRPLVKAQWKALVKQLAPTVQQLMDEDQASGRPQDHRLRIGMYMYNAAAQPSSINQTPDATQSDDPSTA